MNSLDIEYAEENAIEKPKRDMPVVKKPRVFGVALLLIAKGVLSLIMSLYNLSEIFKLMNNPLYEVYSWAIPLNIFLIGFSIASIFAAILIWRYKQFGLVLGGIVILIDLALGVLAMAANSSNVGSAMLFNLWAIYYIYKYLTDSEKNQFFS